MQQYTVYSLSLSAMGPQLILVLSLPWAHSSSLSSACHGPIAHLCPRPAMGPQLISVLSLPLAQSSPLSSACHRPRAHPCPQPAMGPELISLLNSAMGPQLISLLSPSRLISVPSLPWAHNSSLSSACHGTTAHPCQPAMGPQLIPVSLPLTHSSSLSSACHGPDYVFISYFVNFTSTILHALYLMYSIIFTEEIPRVKSFPGFEPMTLVSLVSCSCATPHNKC